jgi:hypothetical protein
MMQVILVAFILGLFGTFAFLMVLAVVAELWFVFVGLALFAWWRANMTRKGSHG